MYAVESSLLEAINSRASSNGCSRKGWFRIITRFVSMTQLSQRSVVGVCRRQSSRRLGLASPKARVQTAVFAACWPRLPTSYCRPSATAALQRRRWVSLPSPSMSRHRSRGKNTRKLMTWCHCMNDPLVEFNSRSAFFRLQAKDKMWVKGATALQHSRAEAEQRALASDSSSVASSDDEKLVTLQASGVEETDDTAALQKMREVRETPSISS